jgi:hypothetical protein
MDAFYWTDRRPTIFPKFSTDDFGNLVMAVRDFQDEIPHFQIQISEGTWWHLFDFTDKTLDWENGHDEE